MVENTVPEPPVLSEVPEEPEVPVETLVPGEVNTEDGGEQEKTQVLEEGEAGMPGDGEIGPGTPNQVNGVVHGEHEV